MSDPAGSKKSAQPLLPVGFYGKLPSHGDFVHRGVRDEFINVWDAWLQRALVGSKQSLDGAWLQTYLTSPLWRFVLSRTVVDGAVWAGILMPSVDRVGRYFPLTLVGEFAPDVSPFRLAASCGAWFDALESLALDTLDQSVIDVDDLGARVQSSAESLPSIHGLELGRPTPTQPLAWLGSIDDRFDLSAAFADWMEQRAASAVGGGSLWWTRGSEAVASHWRYMRALPGEQDFVSMLAGDAHANDSVAAQVANHRSQSSFESGAMTHQGHVRKSNQDAFLDRADAGCWCVADGMGGHQGGDIASQMVVDAISAACDSTAASLDEMRAAVLAAIQQTNQRLLDLSAADSTGQFDAGSTIVTLLCEDSRAAVAWAGDSRAYRWRDGVLERLTQDHVEAQASGEPSSVITRAVGGHKDLEIDEALLDLRSGDRLLLCSDGVHAMLTDDLIGTLLAGAKDAAAASRAMIDAVLSGKAQDNLTVVVVFST